VGPAPGVSEAVSLITSHAIDVAVLDINLGDENSYPIASELERRDIPFVFVTGYSSGDLPSQFASRPLLAKPVEELKVLAVLSALSAFENK
jgi:CheY-like chemotaxis protein